MVGWPLSVVVVLPKIFWEMQMNIPQRPNSRSTP